MLCTVEGSLFATRKNVRLDGERLLVVQERAIDDAPIGATFLALDRVDAGVGDRVIVNKEGSSARSIFRDDDIPVQAVIVAVVDHMELARDARAPEPRTGDPA